MVCRTDRKQRDDFQTKINGKGCAQREFSIALSKAHQSTFITPETPREWALYFYELFRIIECNIQAELVLYVSGSEKMKPN